MRPARQTFEAQKLAGREIDDGLVEGLELPAVDAGSQVHGAVRGAYREPCGKIGRAARVRRDRRFAEQRRLHVDQTERLAARGQRHDVHRVHHVGDVGAKAEELDAIGQSQRIGQRLVFGAQRSLAADPNAEPTAAAAQQRDRFEKFGPALLFGAQVGEGADHRHAVGHAEFGANYLGRFRRH